MNNIIVLTFLISYKFDYNAGLWNQKLPDTISEISSIININITD